jgi:hypothetical protein
MCERIEFYRPQHFRAFEFVPPEVYNHLGARSLTFVMDVRTLMTADKLREFFGVPIIINDWFWKQQQGIPKRDWLTQRGYRPPKSKTGAKYSQHRFGRALDCTLVGISATEARDIVVNHPAQFPYITRVEDAVNWLHIDCANVFHHGIQLFQP